MRVIIRYVGYHPLCGLSFQVNLGAGIVDDGAMSLEEISAEHAIHLP